MKAFIVIRLCSSLTDAGREWNLITSVQKEKEPHGCDKGDFPSEQLSTK